MKTIKVLIHDLAAARKAAKEGRNPVLRFSDGTEHVLLPNGQHVLKMRKPRDGHGKAHRRERIKIARLAREAAAEPA